MCGQYNREISTSTNDRLIYCKPILPLRPKGDGEWGHGCEPKVDYNAAAQKLRNWRKLPELSWDWEDRN